MWECRGFADLLPATVEVEQVVGDSVAATDAWPEEAQTIVHALTSRRAEFATTRACARRALQRLGFPPAPIPVGVDREPVWPPAVVGSLTHGAGLRAAAVAPVALCRSTGIDVEPNARLPQDALSLVATEFEVQTLRSLASTWPTVAWDRLLFSAKEAVFKAWFPITGNWLDFTDCTLSIDVEAATFHGRLHLEGDPRSRFDIEAVDGRWGIEEERLLTAVALAPHRDQ